MRKSLLVIVACLLLSSRLWVLLKISFYCVLALLSIPVYPIMVIMFYYGPVYEGGRWDHSRAVRLDNWIGGFKRFNQLAIALTGSIILYSILVVDFLNYQHGLVSLKDSLILLWVQLPALTLVGVTVAVSLERFSNAYSADMDYWQRNPIFGD